jgi:hypothetical protein
MTITIINDCKDSNAVGRQQARVSSIFGIQPNFIGVESDLEAAGNIIDVLDAVGESKALVLVNVAPRDGKAKQWENGTPFGYFYYKNTLIVTTIDGYVLSLVKKFELTEKLSVLDTPAVVDEMIANNYLKSDLRSHVINTQFRSYEFLPLVASYILKNKTVKSITSLSIEDVLDIPKTVWYIDNFGNCKTTLTSEDINFETVRQVQLSIINIQTYARLKDVPNKEAALIIGSSGLGSKRFLELTVQGSSAANKFDLVIGDTIM